MINLFIQLRPSFSGSIFKKCSILFPSNVIAALFFTPPRPHPQHENITNNNIQNNLKIYIQYLCFVCFYGRQIELKRMRQLGLFQHTHAHTKKKQEQHNLAYRMRRLFIYSQWFFHITQPAQYRFVWPKLPPS